MINFYSEFVQCKPGVNATMQDVIGKFNFNWSLSSETEILKFWNFVEHIEYVRNITGPDHLGIGADYDGVSKVPIGLEDVSKYPDLFEALYDTGRWSATDLEKLAGRNLLRVFRDVEKVQSEINSIHFF